MAADDCSGSFFYSKTRMMSDCHHISTKGAFSAEVLSNQQIRQCYWRMNLKLDPVGSRLFEKVRPGQFLEIDLSNLGLPADKDIPDHLQPLKYRHILLRRPFSFSDVVISPTADGFCVKLEILYCVLGPATLRMMTLKSGQTLSIIGPLGNGFTVPNNLKTALLIAGGMGAPPLLHLASWLKRHQPELTVVCFAGAKSCEDLPFTLKIGNLTGLVLEEFDVLGVSSFVATDDGSAGFKGYISDCVRHWLQKQTIHRPAVMYACGPESMLAACARLAEDFDIPCQVSMERMMACGIGLCQSCAVEVKSDNDQTEYKLCCKDGPVFDARNVIFLT